MIYTKKAGMQLSINMIVTLIIMIIIFSFGIYLFAKIINTAEDLDDRLRSDQARKLIEMKECDTYVCVLNPQETYKGEALVYILRIENSQGAYENKFSAGTINCKFTPHDSSIESSQCDSDEWSISPSLLGDGFTLKNNKREHKVFLLVPQRTNGVYTIKFNINRGSVDAHDTSEEYGSVTFWANT